MADKEPFETLSEQDRIKLSVDVMKHLTTLATGIIVLVPTLLDKIFAVLVLTPWLIMGLVSLAVCITTACSYLFCVVHIDVEEPDERPARIILLGSLFTSALAFVVGVISISTFTVLNLLANIKPIKPR
jgi:hypothetical protein